MRAMVCKVLPRPISSAKMQPVAFAPDRPITHEYMNCRQRILEVCLFASVRTLTPAFW
jgi:hypothetical protein